MANEKDYPSVYRRETLYGEVWAEPLKIAAARYGVSDVALGKACRKMAVPLPGRGYWAKKAAGKAPPTPVLPPLPTGTHDALYIQHVDPPEPEREASPEIAERMASEADPEAAIVVSAELIRPHRLVREAGRLLRRRRGDPASCLDVAVSRESLDRALLIMDALLKALVTRGLTVEVTDIIYTGDRNYRYPDWKNPESNATGVQVEGEWVLFGLKEKWKYVIPPAPDPPKHLRGEERANWIRWNAPRRTQEPNGVLAFVLKNVDYLHVRKEWKDGTRTKLEDQLNDIVAHIYLAGEALNEKRLADERAAIAKRQREIREYEEYLRREEEKRRVKVLAGQMERWRDAQTVRDYAEAVRQALVDHGLRRASRSHGQSRWWGDRGTREAGMVVGDHAVLAPGWPRCGAPARGRTRGPSSGPQAPCSGMGTRGFVLSPSRLASRSRRGPRRGVVLPRSSRLPLLDKITEQAIDKGPGLVAEGWQKAKTEVPPLANRVKAGAVVAGRRTAKQVRSLRLATLQHSSVEEGRHVSWRSRRERRSG
jgi:hypothetical protein